METRVREDGLGEDVLDEGEAGAEVDVLDVEGVGAPKPDVHHPAPNVSKVLLWSGMARSCIPYFVQVFPKLHLRGIAAQLVQVRPHEHFPVKNLRAVLAWLIIQRTLEACAPRRERPCRDVIL